MARPNYNTFSAAANLITAEAIRINRGVKIVHVSVLLLGDSSNPDISVGVEGQIAAPDSSWFFDLFPNGSIVSKTNNSPKFLSWEGEFILSDFNADLKVSINNEHTAAVDVAVNFKVEDL